MVLLGTAVKGIFVRRTQGSPSPPPAEDGDAMRKRILGAAFKLFVEKGYAGTSTLEIATRAKVSKRDLYASVGNKQAMLVAGITGRTATMQLRPELAVPRSRQELASTLNAYATRLMVEVSDPTVIATFRLAIGEATRSPEIAQALEATGRHPSRDALTDLFASAQSARVIGAGNPSRMATQYLGLVWEDLMVSLLLGVASTPKEDDIRRRAGRATSAFLQLHAGSGQRAREGPAR
jgi:AcrR family transcriptional regulator